MKKNLSAGFKATFEQATAEELTRLKALFDGEEADAVAIECDYLLDVDEFPSLLAEWAKVLKRSKYQDVGDALEVISTFICDFLAYARAKQKEEDDAYQLAP